MYYAGLGARKRNRNLIEVQTRAGKFDPKGGCVRTSKGQWIQRLKGGGYRTCTPGGDAAAPTVETGGPKGGGGKADPTVPNPPIPQLDPSKKRNRKALMDHLDAILKWYQPRDVGIDYNLSGWQMTNEQKLEFNKAAMFASDWISTALLLHGVKSGGKEGHKPAIQKEIEGKIEDYTIKLIQNRQLLSTIGASYTSPDTSTGHKERGEVYVWITGEGLDNLRKANFLFKTAETAKEKMEQYEAIRSAVRNAWNKSGSKELKGLDDAPNVLLPVIGIFALGYLLFFKK